VKTKIKYSESAGLPNTEKVSERGFLNGMDRYYEYYLSILLFLLSSY